MKRFGMIILHGLFLISIACLLCSCSFGTQKTTPSDNEVEQVVIPNEEYEVNENGETFGSAQGALVSTEDGVVLNKDKLPDLVEVVNREGLVGYCRAEELYPDPPSDPSEVEEYNKEVSEPLNMYESDGETVIGQFPS